MQFFKYFAFVFSCVDKLYMGPGQLYQDLQNLIHDLSLVNQISSMICSLKGNYQVLYDTRVKVTSQLNSVHFQSSLSLGGSLIKVHMKITFHYIDSR